MTPERLARLVSAYGAHIGRWPEDEREAAQALLAGDEAYVRNATALDGALDRFVVPRPDSAMIGRSLAAFAAAAPASLLRRWWFAPLLAGAGALGMVAGALLLAVTPAERLTGWFDDHLSIFSAAPGDPVGPEGLWL
jgi:hypothetical protein